MSLRFALLGLLARESLTGYDLTKRFDTTIGFFWSAKHSQIYPELANLTKEGLVTFEVVAQTSKPNKKVYTITDAGREALIEWVAEPREKRTVKDPLMMRIWALGVVPPEQALPQLREALEEYEQRAAILEEMEREAQQNDAFALAPGNPWVGPGLALRFGQTSARCYRDWLKEAIAQLEMITTTATSGRAPAS